MKCVYCVVQIECCVQFVCSLNSQGAASFCQAPMTVILGRETRGMGQEERGGGVRGEGVKWVEGVQGMIILYL